MKLKIAFLLLLCPILPAIAQEKHSQSPPALPWKTPIRQVINYPADSLRLSGFGGKLLILDFWASYCTPCLGLLPKYAALQQKMGEKVQFILVTRENAATAAACLRRLHITLPCVTSDRLLAAAFPHTSIPHEVWVSNGRELAATFGEQVSRETIERVLNGGTVGEQKQDNLAFNALEPLLLNGNGGKGRALYQSLITRYIPGLNSTVGYRSDSARVISFGLNLSVLRLYQQAYSHIDPLLEQDNRYVLLMPDTLKNKIDRGTQATFHDWIKAYGFCYDLVLPPGDTAKISERMVADLNRFFGAWYHIRAAPEQQAVDCLVLSRIPGTPSLQSAGGEPMLSIKDSAYVQHNLPVSLLVQQLARQYRRLATPLVDDTGYRAPVDLVIHAKLEDLADLQKELTGSGLQLRLERRTISMIVIKPLDRPAI